MVYPNPTNGIVNFKVNSAHSKDLDVMIHTVYGQPAGNFRLSNGNLRVDLSMYSSGFYFYTVKSDGVTVLNGRIVKE
jgi:hypothetical protein